jgi:hypothetical protein
MAFDPDAYLGTKASAAPVASTGSGGFDPDAYLGGSPDEPVAPKRPFRFKDTTAETTPKEQPIEVTQEGTFGRSAVEAALATPGALVGAKLGAKAGFAMAPLVGPVIGPFAKPVGSVVGGVIGGIAGSMGIDSIEGVFDKVFGTNIRGIKQEQQKQYPGTAIAGQVVGGGLNPWMRFGLAGSAKDMALGAGVMTGVGAGMRAAEGGDILDPKAIAGDVISGALTKPTDRGMRLLGHAPSDPTTGGKKTKDDPITKPTESSTPEERAKYIGELKKRLAAIEEKSPLKQAAFKNKEDGTLELVGPRHDDARKLETADTHEQGFVDDRGNFLTRKEAWNRATKTGQIPKGQIPEIPADGLHSADLRKAGVKEFELPVEPVKPPENVTDNTTVPPHVDAIPPVAEQPITGDKPTDVPTSPEAPKAPVSREDFKSAIEGNEARRLRLEINAEEALSFGDTARATDLNNQAKQLELEQQQLHKDMPAVQIENKVKPNWEELHDLVWGSKTYGDALDRMAAADVGSAGQKILLRALSSSGYIRGAAFKLNKDFIEYAAPDRTIRKDAAGLYRPHDHTVELGQQGNIQVLLHEGVHVGTHAMIQNGKGKAAKELKRLLEFHKDGIGLGADAAMAKWQAKYPKASIKEASAYRQYLEYGLSNEHEFIAEAFTNLKFQEILAQLPANPNAPASKLNNLWVEFKRLISDGLGLKDRTALDDVLDQGAKMIEASKKKKVPSNMRNEEETYAVASRYSDELHAALDKDGIPMAHSSPHKFGMFNWIKHALTGEGAMIKGAGTYFSTSDPTNASYQKMSKDAAVEKMLEANPDMQNQRDDLIRAKARSANIFQTQVTKIEHYIDHLKDLRKSLKTETDPNLRGATINREAETVERLRKLRDELEELRVDQGKDASALEAFDKNLKADLKVPTYHTTLKATREELLDWEATKQSSIVEKAFEKLGLKVGGDNQLVFENDGGGEYYMYNPKSADGEQVAHITHDRHDDIYRVELTDSGHTGEFTSISAAKDYIHNELGTTEVGSTGQDLYNQLSRKLRPSWEESLAEYRKLFPDEEHPWEFKIERMQKHLGDVRASIALAEQGVAGNVHDAQFGKERTHRNYVAFDDTKVDQNFVELASKGEPTEPKTAKTEPTADETPNARDIPDHNTFMERATDVYEKKGEDAALKFYEEYQDYKRTWREPIKEVEKFVGINLRTKSANERIIHNERAKFLKDIPNEADRIAIAEAIDSGNKDTLTGKNLEAANRYEAAMEDIGERAVKEGVTTGLLDNYVTHIIDWEGAPKGAKGEFLDALLGTKERDPSMKGMTPESKFGKKRTFKTFEDLQFYIDNANDRIAAAGNSEWHLKIKTKDIAEVYKEYALSMEKAIENKKLITSIQQIRNPAGESLIKDITKETPLPRGWEVGEGQLAGKAIHPDLLPALKFVFDAGPGGLMKSLGFVSQLVKRLNVVGSFFHAKSLMEVMSSAKVPLWTPIKEAIVLPLVEKGVKAATGKDLQLSAISKAVEQYKKGGVGDNVDRWIKEDGLQLEVPEDVSQGVLTATGKFADEMITKFGPKTRALEKTLSLVERKTLGIFDKYTWDYLHTGGKLMMADAYLDKARIDATKSGKSFDEAAVRKEIASFVNDSFGGLNWFDAATKTRTDFGKKMAMATYSPEGRRALQIGLFAPDWTISTIRAFTAALPKELNPAKWHPVEGAKGLATPVTKADYARLYQLKTLLTYATLVNAINLMTADRNIWENKDPTRIEWPDGTSMQAMKHAAEPYHWLMDPVNTLSNKLGFIPKAGIVSIAGTEYASPQAQKLADPSFVNRTKAVATMVMPFQAQAARGAPEGEGTKRAVLGTLGFPVYGSTPEQRKQIRKERDTILKEKAKKYHDKEKTAGRER